MESVSRLSLSSSSCIIGSQYHDLYMISRLWVSVSVCCSISDFSSFRSRFRSRYLSCVRLSPSSSCLRLGFSFLVVKSSFLGLALRFVCVQSRSPVPVSSAPTVFGFTVRFKEGRGVTAVGFTIWFGLGVVTVIHI